MLASRPRRRTVRRNKQTEIPHFCVVRRAYDAAVRREPRQDQRRRSQMQQDFQRRLKEGRMHRLEHDVILVVGPPGFDEGSASATRYQAAFHKTLGIGTPLAEIIVDIDGGNARAPAPLLQFGQRTGFGQGVLQDLVGVRELESQQIQFLRFCWTSTARFRPLRVSSCRASSKSWSPNMVLARRSGGIKTGQCSTKWWACLLPRPAPSGSGGLLPGASGSARLLTWSAAQRISFTARRGGNGNKAFLRWKGSGIPLHSEICVIPKTLSLSGILGSGHKNWTGRVRITPCGTPVAEPILAPNNTRL